MIAAGAWLDALIAVLVLAALAWLLRTGQRRTAPPGGRRPFVGGNGKLCAKVRINRSSCSISPRTSAKKTISLLSILMS